jgi:hypothetical protein
MMWQIMVFCLCQLLLGWALCRSCWRLLLDFKPRIASFGYFHAGCYLYATNTKRIMELSLTSHGIFWVAMFFLILGSGRFGIDYLLTRKIKL